MAEIYELKEEYSLAIYWFRKAIDKSIDQMVDTGGTDNLFTKECYEKFLLSSSKNQTNGLSPIDYMKEIISKLLQSSDQTGRIHDLMAIIYRITVQFYHYYDKSKIQSICNHIVEVLNQITIHENHWTKWLCIGSMCS